MGNHVEHSSDGVANQLNINDEKALDCSKAVAELNETLAELYESKFNNIADDYENQLALIEHLTNTYENGLDQLETAGYLESTNYYTALQDAEEQTISVLNKELNELKKSFSEAMASGTIKQNSESWYEMQQAINDVKEELQEANTQLIEYQRNLRETEWGYFDYEQERIGQLTSEAEFLIDLLDNQDLYDDRGQFNDRGTAAMGLHGVNYNIYMAQADQYAKEMQKINEAIAKDPYDTELIERREELLELQQESISAAEDEKEAIKDLVSDGIDIELDALQDLIDEYNDALDTAKDLYDYQNDIKDQTEEIARLQKQLSAYSGDTSEEAQSTIQQIQVDLENAQQELEESEYDKYISDQKELLDQLYTEYEEVLNQRLDNIDVLIQDMIDSANVNTDSINATLNDVANNVGYTLTENMQSIWDGSTNALNGTITTYGTDFSNKLTAVNNVLNSIHTNVQNLVNQSNKKATSTVKDTSKTTTPGKTSSSSSSSNKTNTTTKTIKAGGLINAGSALIYDSIYDKSGERQYYRNDPIYKVLEVRGSFLKVRYHKLSSGVTGWFKKSDVKAYKSGGLIDYTGPAWVDGTKSKPESILSANDTENLKSLSDQLSILARQPLSPALSYYDGEMFSYAHSMPNIKDLLREVYDSAPVGETRFGDINITIPIEHVEDYNDFVNQLRADRKFEKMIQDMTVNRIAGNNSLSKNKYRWT